MYLHPTKWPRLLALFLILPASFLLLQSGWFGVGTVILSAGCGGGGTGGGTVSEDGDPGSFSTEAPIDIPVPIAKGIDGVDPTTVTFTESTESGVAGILSAYTIGNIDATVALIRSGEVYGRAKTTAGKVEFEIPTELLGETLALVVEGTGENEGLVSAPVLVTLSSDNEEETTVTVAVTNTGVIQYQQIAVSSGGNVAFAARNSADEPFVGTVSVNGGSPSVLATTTNFLGELQYDSSGTVFGIDTTTALLTTIPSDGSVSTESGSSEITADGRHMSLSPDGGWILLNTVSGGSVVGAVMSVESGTDGILLTPTESQVTAINFDWISDDVAAVVKQFADGSYAVQTYGALGAVEQKTPSALTVSTEVTSTRYRGEPTADRVNSRYAFTCGNSSGTNSLCLHETEGEAILSGGEFSGETIVHPRFSSDGTAIVYEQVDEDSSLSNCDGNLRSYSLDSNTTRTFAKGCFPAPHPTNPNLVAYLTPVGGKLQVGIFNAENVDLSSDDGDEGDSSSGIPSKLSLSLGTGASQTAGACDSLLLRILDTDDNTVALDSSLTVYLSGAGSGAFYGDAACSTTLSSFVMSSGASRTRFYFRTTTIGIYSPTATDPSGSLTASTATTSVGPATAIAIRITGSSSPLRGACTVYNIEMADTYGNAAAAPSATTLTLSNTGLGFFWNTAGCSDTTAVITSTTFTAGLVSQNIYFADYTAETTTLRATDSIGGLTAGTLSVTVVAP